MGSDFEAFHPLRPGRPEWVGINFERKYLKEERIV
jgi:hypothetical protein